jgi:3-hydroxypropanoate dehydrogenase
MAQTLNPSAIDQLFRTARSHNKWQDRPVELSQLHALYDLMKWGPTSANTFPLRVVFVTSAAAKARLIPLVFEGNRSKVQTAPVTAILAYDLRFADWLPRLFPHKDMRPFFVDKPALIEATAFRNSSLQGGYLMLAARALGLDCGPMSGFDSEAVDKAFFPEGDVKSNFICALGHGDPTGLYPRSPRPEFDDVCRVA